MSERAREENESKRYIRHTTGIHRHRQTPSTHLHNTGREMHTYPMLKEGGVEVLVEALGKLD